MIARELPSQPDWVLKNLALGANTQSQLGSQREVGLEIAARKRNATRKQGVLTSNHFGALKVLVRVQIAGRQGKPQANGEEEQIRSAPHVDVAFFLWSPGQASTRSYLCF